jgi:hypothetical protein
MHPPAEHPAVATLRSFFAAMEACGAKMIEHHASIDWGNADEDVLQGDRARQRRELEAIFEEFCEVGTKAKTLQDMGLAFNLGSPEYDPTNELVTSVCERSRRIVVETQQINEARWRFRYELVNVDGRWKVRDNKKRGSDRNPAWRPDLL